MENAFTLEQNYPRVRRIGPISTVVLMALVLFPQAWAMLRSGYSIFAPTSLAYLFGGGYFVDCFAPFDKVNAGFCLDQPTIGKWLFWFAWFSVITLSYAAVIGFVSDRTTRAGRLAFAIPAVLLVVLLISSLLPPLQWLIQYLHSMGFTPKRIYGLAYVAASITILLLFVRWAIRPGRATAASGLAFVLASILAPALACLFYERHLGLLLFPFELLGMLMRSAGFSFVGVYALAYVMGSCAMIMLLVFWTIQRPHVTNSEVSVDG